jgi:hypothetical protein
MRFPSALSLHSGALAVLLAIPLALPAQDTRPLIGPELPPNMRREQKTQTETKPESPRADMRRTQVLDNSADANVPAGTVLGPNVRPGVNAQAALKFEHTFVDFGDIEEGETVTAKFPFINNSNNTITITNTQTTCGCTVATLAKKVFAPGEGDTVQIAFNSANRPGLNDRLIRVMTDEPGISSYAVRLRANVIQDVWLSQRVAGFGEVPVGESRDMTINLMSIAEEPIKILGVENTRGDVRVELGEALPYHVPTRPNQGVQIPITITLPDDRPTGRVSGNVIVRTNQPGAFEKLSIIYSANVVGALTYSPARLYFGVVPPNSKQMTRGSISVTSGEGAFELDSWEVLPINVANSEKPVTPAEHLPRLNITVEEPTSDSILQSLIAVAEIPDQLGHLQGNLLLKGHIGDKPESVQIPISVYVREMPALQSSQPIPPNDGLTQRRPAGQTPGS